MATVKIENNRGEGSFGSKRSRNDAKEGDWTCPQCGNVNFSFRVVCNRGACAAPRPSPTLSPGLAAVQNTVGLRYEQRGNAYYNGSHPPVSAYGAHPPVPVSGYGQHAGQHGQQAAAELAYQQLNMRYGYPPAPYGPSASYGPYSSYAGTGYGPTAYMSRYSFGYRGSPLPSSTSPWTGGALPDTIDTNASRKRRGGPDGAMDGDWVCPKCENRNFAFRTTCNMKKCGAPRPAELNNMKKEGGEIPEGSWTCTKCSNLNYPFRNVCNRKGCGNDKPASLPNSV